MATPGKAVFGRDISFNFKSVVDWRVATTVKKLQVDIDNDRENSKRFMHDYEKGHQVYVEKTGIYRKHDYTKQ